MGYLCANFSLPRPLCSRLRPDVCERQTDVSIVGLNGQTSDEHHRLSDQTNFLHLFAFLVSRPPQSALLHCQAPTLLLNRWCLTGSSILVLKLTFSPDPFPRNLPLSNGLISRFLSRTCTEVSGVENIGQCGRLSQLRWLLGPL